MKGGFGCLMMVMVGIILVMLLGYIIEPLEKAFGPGTSDKVVAATILVGIAVAIILSVRATIRARAAAARIIRFDRDYPEEPGPFGRWFTDQSRLRNSDQMRVDDAVRAFLKAYGGRAVVGYLIREGYEGLIEADLLDVFDVDRAQRVGSGIYSATYRLPWWASLAALITGGIIGYRATTRR